MLLRDIAHARSGDKGNDSNISVWVHDRAHFDHLVSCLSEERLRAHFGDLLKGDITIHRLDHLGGLNIVLRNVLEGGVNSSLNLDGHGKSWSTYLLGLEIAPPPPG